MRKHLEITTYIGCPVRCSYCPQDTLIMAYKGVRKMSLEVFKKILSNTPNDIEIHFSGFSEPFWHKDIIEFIKEAKKEHEVVVYTTTVGMMDWQIKELENISFKEFNVHIRQGAKELPFKHDKVTVDDSNKISRGGNLWFIDKHEGVCSRSPKFKQNVVLPNGDVYLCCMDYGLKHKLGNLLEQNFNELDRSGMYELCKTCEKYI